MDADTASKGGTGPEEQAEPASKGGTGPKEQAEPETEDYLAVEARCMIAVGSNRDTDRSDG